MDHFFIGEAAYFSSHSTTEETPFVSMTSILAVLASFFPIINFITTPRYTSYKVKEKPTASSDDRLGGMKQKRILFSDISFLPVVRL